MDTLIIACRPVRITDLSPNRRRIWDAIEASGLDVPQIYPGSVYGECDVCHVQVAIGPRQQQQLKGARVVCMVDAAALSADFAADGDDVGLINLGNPFKRKE